MTFETGVFDWISEDHYHASNALSSTGARTLITKSPAEFRFEQVHGRPPKTVFDEGHAAHKYVLGEGNEIVVAHGFTDWRKNDAKDIKAKAYADGKVPLLPQQDAIARAVADAVKKHRLAGALFAEGVPEQSGWWVDPDTGVYCRYRADWTQRRSDWLLLVDLKTSDKPVSPTGFAKSVYDYGYHIQDPWYVEGARMLHPDVDRISFLFVVVSKSPPHIVTVCELDTEAKEIGARRGREAREIYARCLEADDWPDYGIGPHLISLPKWATYREENL